MGIITIPAELQALLSKLREKTELHNSDGEIIGIFLPKQEAEAELIEEARRIFDLDEARRRLAEEKKYFTTAEVLAHLNSQETSE